MTSIVTSTTTSSVPRGRRRQSTIHTIRNSPRITCNTLPHSLEALDLSSASPIPTLASIRVLVLSYLADLETRLSQIDSPLCELGFTETLKTKGELTVEDARAWARDGLEMLNQIRIDVSSHLPELNLDSASASVETYVSSHLPDLPDVPSLKDVASHLPEMPDVRSRLPQLDLSDVRFRIDDVCSRFSDIDLHKPLNYIPTLSRHLQSLQSHLSSIQHSSSIAFHSFAPNTMLFEFIDRVRSDIGPSVIKAEDKLEWAAREVTLAVKRSVHGARLIKYADLPQQWRNNPFVTHGYRFIPLNRWHLIIMSIFALHNETLNIHTHLIPFVLWTVNFIPSLRTSSIPSDAPLLAFTAFALLCLFSSVLWHTMAGCAHHRGMELCAKIDYVGIGWLISASVGTIVYYGFQCHANPRTAFLGVCLAAGLAGSVLPFMSWFDKPENKKWRIAFFLCLSFTAIAPLTHLSILHSTRQTLDFVRPITPSLVSYVTGLVFYASNFPERALPARWAPRAAWLGGGSHAIWHAFIVLAISQHRSAMGMLKYGIAGIDDIDGGVCW